MDKNIGQGIAIQDASEEDVDQVDIITQNDIIVGIDFKGNTKASRLAEELAVGKNFRSALAKMYGGKTLDNYLVQRQKVINNNTQKLALSFDIVSSQPEKQFQVLMVEFVGLYDGNIWLKTTLALKESRTIKEGFVNRFAFGFYQFVEDADFFILLLNDRRNIVYANSCFLSATEYNSSNLDNSRFDDMFIPSREKQIFDTFFHSLQVRQTKEIYLGAIRKKNQQELNIRWFGKRISDDAHFILLFGIDVTGQDAMQKQLRSSESRFRALFELSPVGIALIDFDSEKFVEVNDAFLKPMKRSKQEIIGTHTYLYSPSEYKALDERARHQLEKYGFYTHFQKDFIDRDGQRYPVEVHGTIIREANDRRLIWTIVEDISLRKTAEENILNNERRLKSAQQLALICSLEMDLKAGTQTWSDTVQDVLGLLPQEVSFGRFMAMIDRDDWQRVEKAYTKAAKDYQGYEITHKITDAKGNKKYLKHQCIANTEQNGKRLFITLQDVTKQKSIENELKRYRDHLEELVENRTQELISARDLAEKANKSKSDFFSRMSHELRTPLNAILGFSEILLLNDAIRLEKDALDNVNEIYRAGDHLKDMINDVLELSKIEAGEIKFTYQSTCVKSIIDECVKGLSSLTQKRGITVVQNIEEDLASINVDPLRFKQIIVNIINNAIKYNKEGGKIIIDQAISPDHKLTINIRDTGIGIKEEVIGQIFKPFERAVSPYEAIEGTGIGLAICREFVETMSGVIGVESEENIGSNFWIQFPIDSYDVDNLIEKSQSTVLQKHEDNKPKKNIRVLYIEDNLVNIKLLRKIVKNHLNYEFYEALTGQAGIGCIEEEPFDIVLVDITLPDMSGFDVVNTVRRDIKFAKLPMIAVTAHAYKDDEQKALAHGFNAFISKPIDTQALCQKINTLLARAQE
ncbi:PAS domain S-box protein [Teredinibacter sp. KSP-S5-2]|uniref:PAS domain-containing hybrid sensor histidine kinase/response regulator n=1 Tax=Teredinibacter sp. KSP-S5-2 TaxID=3034506 RepID=UPI002935011B|nr:PAS domain S-box protein [Teredinibacter sp. KSP-S5-2]WNO11404.1 PAS domain S-box protein [Teredinibacter sp. KSP-S5-2]